MNLFYMLAYKNCPIAYTLTKGEALTLTSCMPQSMTWQKVWADSSKDLCLPYVGDVPMSVWKVLSEIEFEKIQKNDLTKALPHGIINSRKQQEDNKVNAWELNAKTVKEIYGSYVDYEERFYICPNCEEPVYEEDWPEETMTEFMCPYCGEPLFEKEE